MLNFTFYFKLKLNQEVKSVLPGTTQAHLTHLPRPRPGEDTCVCLVLVVRRSSSWVEVEELVLLSSNRGRSSSHMSGTNPTGVDPPPVWVPQDHDEDRDGPTLGWSPW